MSIARAWRWATPLAAALVATASVAAGHGAPSATEPAGRTLQRHGVPGAALARVENGRIVALRAIGRLQAGAPEPVDEDTLFRVGSVSKTFTAMALSLLVVEGRLALNDPVQQHLPELAAWPGGDSSVRIEDLLTHRSGIDLPALDLLLWPQPNDYTAADVLAAAAALRRLAPAGRAFAYSNAGYVLLGEIVARLSGMPFERYVQQRLWAPLGLHGCSFGAYAVSNRRTALGSVATPHIGPAGVALPVRPDEGWVPVGVDAAAGGARCSIRALARWVQWLSAPGGAAASEPPELRRALGLAATPRALIAPVSVLRAQPGHVQAYGLGLEIVSRGGRTAVQHGGSVAGMSAYIAAWPGDGVGVALVLNKTAPEAHRQLVAGLHRAAGRAIEPAPVRRGPDAAQAAAAIPLAKALPDDDVAVAWAGVYQSTWLGPVALCRQDGAWLLRVLRSPRLVADLSRDVTAAALGVSWRDPAVDSDAWLERDADGALRLRPRQHADFDFSYLRLVRSGLCPAGARGQP